MYLKRLELQGFKSFANKTVIKFEDGITAVVGPNGSGKSNISDSVRWVLGEQSAKTLRGEKMEDIIFSGTEHRNPLGYAEVSLVLNNESGIFNLEFKEIVITRRVFRTGDSEYLINGKAARLKDIREVFMDTGIGKDGYSIISQGKIDEILSSKSEDRRNIFEEAAGIVKYKTRKQESERKLEKTRENLIRIDDIISEIETQISPLEEQAEKAEKYIGYMESLKKYEIELLSNEMKEYKEEKDKYQSSIAEKESELISLKSEKEKESSELESCEALRAETDSKLAEANERRYSLIRSTEEINGNIKLKTENKSRNDEEIVRVQRSIDELQNEKESSTAEKSQLEEELRAADEELEKRKSALTEAEQSLNNLEEVIKKLEDKTEKLKGSNIDNLNAISEMKVKLSSLDSNFSNYGRREDQINRSLSDIDSRGRDALSEKERADEDYQRVQSSFEELSGRLEDKRAELAELQRIAGESGRRIEALKIQYEKDKSSLKLLKEMQEDYEGYYKGVKGFLSGVKGTPIDSGVEGVVAELVKTKRDYEKAIEVALGAAIQNIVTLNTEYAKESISFLKRSRLGRITFLPMDNIKGRGLNDREASVLSENGVIGRASELVEFDEKYRNIFENILGRVIIVDNMDNMTAASKKYSNAFKMVTLDGDVMNPGGSMTGGSFKGNSLSLLGRSRQIDDLNQKLDSARAEYESEKKKADENLSKTGVLKEAINALESEAADISRRRTEIEGSLRVLSSSAQNIESERESLLDELKQIAEEKARIEEDKKAIEADMNMKSEANTLNDQEVAKSGSELERLKKEASEKNGQYMNARLEFVSLSESRKSVESRAADLEAGIRKAENRISEESRRISVIESESAALEGELSDLRRGSEELESQSEKNRLEIEALNGEKSSLAESIRAHEDRIKDIDLKHDEIQSSQSTEKVKLERVNANIDGVRSRLWEEYELSVMAAESVEKSGLENSELRREVGDFRKRIRGLGNVNLDSIEELKSVSERFEFLSSQREDLVEGEKSLKVVIKEMNAKMREQFLKRFEEIREQFKLVFVELFGGGRADIIIEDMDDILNSGIEVIAEPPGKKLQNLTLLSGGERALTAISILFAILKTKPTPFCILDEIEAALDEANVYRYAEYLKKFSEESQFIVITHRKGTMEAANSIYGVTMQNNGVSELLSVKLNETEEKEPEKKS